MPAIIKMQVFVVQLPTGWLFSTFAAEVRYGLSCSMFYEPWLAGDAAQISLECFARSTDPWDVISGVPFGAHTSPVGEGQVLCSCVKAVRMKLLLLKVEGGST